MQDDTHRTRRRLRPSDLTLTAVLGAAALGALLLARQPPNPRLARPQPPPAWSMVGHDVARTGHSLSPPLSTRQPLSLVWWLQLAFGARTVIVDGNGNLYIAQPDGALLALDAEKRTRWCAAQQPSVIDPSCKSLAEQLALPPFPAPPPVTPNPILGPDGRLYVVGQGGVARVFGADSVEQWNASLGLVPDDGVVFGNDSGIFYGVVAAGRVRGQPAFAVAALRWGGHDEVGWRRTPIPSRGLAPVSVAPDGTLLVTASSPVPGGLAMLYALAPHTGAVLWRRPLAAGKPSWASVDGTVNNWVAWVAVNGMPRSSVIVVDQRGRLLWHWTTGHRLVVSGGGVTLARHDSPQPQRSGRGYVGSDVGVFALNLSTQPRGRKGWLFLNTRLPAMGPTGPPVTDARGNVYVGTEQGRVYSVDPRDTAHPRWVYDTGRDARGPLVLTPYGAVVVVSHDPSGVDVVEELGSGGQVVATAGAACAAEDCPTPVPSATPTLTITPTATLTPSVTMTPAATLTPTLTSTPTATTPTMTLTLTITPAVTLTSTVTITPTTSLAPAVTITPAMP